MGILLDLNQAISNHKKELSDWYETHLEKMNLPIYASVDIRNSGFKISSVDTNLFPSGFNNVYCRDLQVASSFVGPFLKNRYGDFQKILILPEYHTRNQPYLENLQSLVKLFTQAGFQVEVGILSAEMRKSVVQLPVGDSFLKVYQIQREGNKIRTENFIPDLILLNNDFSLGPPDLLNGIDQFIDPPLKAGWYSRKKSEHFKILHNLINEAAQILKVDPWVMKVETEVVKEVDIQDQNSREKLAKVAERVLKHTQNQYNQHGIKDKPYVFLKDNSGTYGLAVFAVRDPEEILTMNSKTRKKMATGKGRSKVTEILVQEGVPTKDLINDCPAEPVIYLAGGQVIGGFFRKHCDQDELESLNVKGMLFSILTFSSPLETTPPEKVYHDDIILQVYGNFARIAYLATGYELKEHLS